MQKHNKEGDTNRSYLLRELTNYPESRILKMNDMTLTLPPSLRCLWCCCVQKWMEQNLDCVTTR